eukprot:Seg3905.1 transcript_id=Seg3905.1/GoldUCD/mRNA.D3Y31 product="hypothetical protein" protein_id=Seg3905.1/GoldUCD/D3Y31
MRVISPALLIVTAALVATPSTARIPYSRGVANLGNRFLSRYDPAKMTATASTVTSLYVGSTGIWFRSDTIAAINQLERGEKEEALQSLQMAISTLAVFDITQATVQPIASVMINKMIKKKGFFPTFFEGLTSYKRALPDAVLTAGNSADDVLDVMIPLKESIKDAFEREVTAFMRRSQGYDDLVTSLRNAKTWAKVARWGDVLAGPIFDSAMVGFSAYQLHLAINDKDSASEVRELNIASASLGIASGAVGIASFAVAALATAGTALAAFAGPIGAIIGCLLGLTAIIIDLVNSVNPYNNIKQQLETLHALKTESLKFLDTPVNIARDFTPHGLNTGFDTIYEVNQAALIDFAGARTEGNNYWLGLDKDPTIFFKARDPVQREGDYLANGKNRVYDKSRYQNIFFRPEGTPHIGYDFYGKNGVSSTSEGHRAGVTVRVNTALIADNFWQRGIEINTLVQDDEEKKAPDNVIIGHVGSLSRAQGEVRVATGAGDDVLQLTGMVFVRDNARGRSLVGLLGSGINTLSFRGFDRSKLDSIKLNDIDSKVIAIHFNMVQNPNPEQGKLYLKLDNSEKVHKGTIAGVSVFYGSPINDVITFDARQNAVIKETSGRNKYVMQLEDLSARYAHTIEDDSDQTATIKFKPGNIEGRFTKENLRFSKEANTIVVYNPVDGGHSHGKIMLKRKDGDLGTHFRIKIPATRNSNAWTGNLEELAENEVGTNDGFDLLVYGIPYKYFMNRHFTVYTETRDKCNFFLLDLNPPDEEPSSGEVNYNVEFFFPNSYVQISNSMMEKLRNENYVLKFSRNSRKHIFTFEKRESKDSDDYIYRITLGVETAYQMKAIVVGDMGSQKLLYDVYNDDHGRIDIYKEWKSLNERPELSYRFNRDYIADTSEGKSIMLGAPTAESSLPNNWKLTLGELTDSSSRNALIVSYATFASIDREGEGQFKIKFIPDETNNIWSVEVSKKNGDDWNSFHKVHVSGATELAYEQGIRRVRLRRLTYIRPSQEFDLYEVMKNSLAGVDAPMSIAETSDCEE